MTTPLITPLATQNRWFYAIFQAIREKHLEFLNSDYLDVLIILAGIFIAFKLIKLSYSIMSDEQSGGFGGASIWEIMRPIVILILLVNCSHVVGFIDGLCNMVTTSLSNDNGFKTMTDISQTPSKMPETIDGVERLKKILADLKTNAKPTAGKEINAILDTAKQNAYGTIIKHVEGLENVSRTPQMKQEKNYNWGVAPEGSTFSDSKPQYSTVFKDHSPFVKTAQQKLDSIDNPEARAAVKNALTYLEQAEDGTLRDKIAVAVRSNSGATEDLKEVSTWLSSFAFWLFNNLFIVMMAFAELYLIIMSMMLPVCLTLCIFDKWKDSFSTWLGRYIEISMWKVVGSMITVIIYTSREAVLTYVQKHSDQIISQIKTLTANPETIELATKESALMISFCIGVAGLISLIKIPSITSSALSIASGALDGSSGATTVISAPIKAAKGAFNAGKAIANKKAPQAQK